MKSHLDRFGEWPSLAQAADYRPAKLAHLTEFSLRQLERYFAERFGQTPRSFLKELQLQEERLRMTAAVERLQQGHLVKTVASDLGFKGSPAFCRKFKRRYGLTPLAFLAQERKSRAQTISVAIEQ